MKLRRGTYVTQTRAADPTGFGGRAANAAMTYEAFVPARVRDIELTLSGAVAADVGDAEAALSHLRARSPTSGLEALSRSLLRSEAVASSWIEALRVSHRKLAEAQQHAPGKAYDEARRVLGNVHAMHTAVKIGADSDPFTVEDILSMHASLMSTSDLRDDRERAGRFRTEPVFIGGTTPRTAEYVGPPHEAIDVLMDDLVAFINARHDLSPTVVAGIAHAQFESIHPFHDGNGRVGRCLIHTILRRAGASDVLPPISIAFAHTGSRYVEGLTAFRNDDLDGWLSVFTTAVTFACKATVGLADRVATLQADWERQLRKRRTADGRKAPRTDSAAMRSLAVLPDMPAFHTRDLSERLEVTWRAAQDAVEELQATGIIKQVSAGKGNRLYEAMNVFSLLDEFERSPEAFLT
jgi:Fic family protein